MSGLAQSFNNAIRQQLQAHAAWLPIVNDYRIGEYGIFNNGIFQSLGNIKEKYPDINLQINEGKTAEIDFTSSGVRTVKLDASGKTVDSFAALGDAEGSLKLMFEAANTSMIKAKFSLEELKNIDEVAKVLAKKSDWRRAFSVVSRVYRGENCVIICSKEAGTEVEIKASADVLRQVEGGKVQGGFEFKASKNSVFKAVGESGVVALKLFKLNLFNRPNVLDTEENGEPVEVPATEEVLDEF